MKLTPPHTPASNSFCSPRSSSGCKRWAQVPTSPVDRCVEYTQRFVLLTSQSLKELAFREEEAGQGTGLPANVKEWFKQTFRPQLAMLCQFLLCDLGKDISAHTKIYKSLHLSNLVRILNAGASQPGWGCILPTYHELK